MTNEDKWLDEIAMIRETNDREDRRNATRRFILLETADGWTVHRDDKAGVAPKTSYHTRESAAARLLQLLSIKGPIEPQSWPERIALSDTPDVTPEQ